MPSSDLLQKGEQAFITQSLGGTYTVIVNGNLFRIEAKDADALGLEVAARPTANTGAPRTVEEIEQETWNQMRTCYDPEIPLNIVDLGLIYDIEVKKDSINVRMSLTAPGCPSSQEISQDIRAKLEEAGFQNPKIELVWDPPWSAHRISEYGKKELGM